MYRPLIPWRQPLVPGRFLLRPHRFGAICQVQGEETLVHVPATGRMRELLVEGVEVGLLPAPAPTEPSAPARKTAWTLVLVRHGEIWVHVDSSGPTRFLPAAIRTGRLEEFEGYATILPEPRVPHDPSAEEGQGAGRSDSTQGRFDFLLTDPRLPRYWIEAKSVTLVRDGVALFPDAPTPRGVRHLRELARLRRGGEEAAAVFVIQREDARLWRPNGEMDPEFAAAVRDAAEAGVKLLAVTMRVSWEGLDFGRQVPVEPGEDSR